MGRIDRLEWYFKELSMGIVCDFNVMLIVKDREGGKVISWYEMEDFRVFLSIY